MLFFPALLSRHADVEITALLLGALFALPMLVVYLWVPWIVDRYDPEPAWALAMTLAWGGIAACGFSALVNTSVHVDGQRRRRRGRSAMSCRRVHQRPARRRADEGDGRLLHVLFHAPSIRRRRRRRHLRDVRRARLRRGREHPLLRQRREGGDAPEQGGDVHRHVRRSRHPRAVGAPPLHVDDRARLRHRARDEQDVAQVARAAGRLFLRGVPPLGVEHRGDALGRSRRPHAPALVPLRPRRSSASSSTWSSARVGSSAIT